MAGDPDRVQYLLHQGASLDILDSDGLSALGLALRSWHDHGSPFGYEGAAYQQAACCLLQAGADDTAADNGRCACSSSGSMVVSVLPCHFGVEGFGKAGLFVTLEWLGLVDECLGEQAAKLHVLSLITRAYFDELGMTHTCHQHWRTRRAWDFLSTRTKLTDAEATAIWEAEASKIAKLQHRVEGLGQLDLQQLKLEWKQQIFNCHLAACHKGSLASWRDESSLWYELQQRPWTPPKSYYPGPLRDDPDEKRSCGTYIDRRRDAIVSFLNLPLHLPPMSKRSPLTVGNHALATVATSPGGFLYQQRELPVEPILSHLPASSRHKVAKVISSKPATKQLIHALATYPTEYVLPAVQRLVEVAPQVNTAARTIDRYLNKMAVAERAIKSRKSDKWMPDDVRNARVRPQQPLGRNLIKTLVHISQYVVDQGGQTSDLEALWRPGGILRAAVSKGSKPRLSEAALQEVCNTLGIGCKTPRPTGKHEKPSDNDGITTDDEGMVSDDLAGNDDFGSEPEVGRDAQPEPDPLSSLICAEHVEDSAMSFDDTLGHMKQTLDDLDEPLEADKTLDIDRSLPNLGDSECPPGELHVVPGSDEHSDVNDNGKMMHDAPGIDLLSSSPRHGSPDEPHLDGPSPSSGLSGRVHNDLTLLSTIPSSPNVPEDDIISATSLIHRELYCKPVKLHSDTLHFVGSIIQKLGEQRSSQDPSLQSASTRVIDPLWFPGDLGRRIPSGLPVKSSIMAPNGQVLCVPVFFEAVQHWALAVLRISTLSVECCYLDSLRSQFRASVIKKRMHTWIKGQGSLPQSLNFFEASCPQQDDGVSCGIFVLSAIYKVVFGEAITKDPIQPSEERRRLLYLMFKADRTKLTSFQLQVLTSLASKVQHPFDTNMLDTTSDQASPAGDTTSVQADEYDTLPAMETDMGHAARPQEAPSTGMQSVCAAAGLDVAQVPVAASQAAPDSSPFQSSKSPRSNSNRLHLTEIHQDGSFTFNIQPKEGSLDNTRSPSLPTTTLSLASSGILDVFTRSGCERLRAGLAKAEMSRVQLSNEAAIIRAELSKADARLDLLEKLSRPAETSTADFTAAGGGHDQAVATPNLHQAATSEISALLLRHSAGIMQNNLDRFVVEERIARAKLRDRLKAIQEEAIDVEQACEIAGRLVRVTGPEDRDYTSATVAKGWASICGR
ncbi:hypothetical protein LIA77_11991 [Sarocladium implicatum]|nr:hypothetical protein LIA77_11991 [Sarocladium implicatum]